MPSNSSPPFSESDSSDDDDDEELFRPTFESHGKKIKRKTKPASNNNNTITNASSFQKVNAEEPLQAKAKRQAMNQSLPAGISSSKELVWYQHTTTTSEEEEQKEVYIPCRICDADEARFISLTPNSWDANEVSLVQALVDETPFAGGKRDRILANKTALIPYNGNQENNNNNITTTTDNNSWCPTLWKQYQQYRKDQARANHTTLSDQDLLVTFYYLQRILQHAQQRQADVEQADNLSSSQDEAQLSSKQQQQQQQHVDSSSQSSIASEDLEVPYAENLCSQPDDYLDVNMFDDDKQTEPLRPGDVIQYTLPIYRAGDKRGLRQSKVLSTNPNRNPILVLQNGDVLPCDTFVKRIQVLEHGQLYPHPHGYFRPIERFLIRKQGNASLKDGLEQQGKEMERIMDSHLTKFEQQAKKNGFAPMDVFHKRKRTKRSDCIGGEVSRGGDDTTNKTKTKQRRLRLDTVKETNVKDDDSDSDSSVEVQVKMPRGGRLSKSTLSAAQHDVDSDSSSCMDVVTKRPGRSKSSTTARAAYDDTDSSSDSDSDTSEEIEVDPEKMETRRLLAKMKQLGTRAFDPSDSDNDSEDEVVKQKKGGTKSSRSKATKQVSKKANDGKKVSKKSSDKVPASKKSTVAKVSRKKSATRPTSKKTGTTKVSKAASSRRKSSKNVPPEPILAAKSGEWMSTRRDTHESLGIESDVTSLASLPSGGRSSEVAKSTGDKTTSSSLLSQELETGMSQDDEPVVVVVDSADVRDRKQVKSNVRQDVREASSYNADSESSDEVVPPPPPRNKNQRRAIASKKDDIGSSSDSSLDGNAKSKSRSSRNTAKSTARSSSPPQEENVVDLLNSPPRKEKPKRASYGSRGKSRVELGQSSKKKKRNKVSSHADSLSFHSSSSSDESSVDLETYRSSRRSGKRDDDPIPGRRKGGDARGRNERVARDDSQSGNTESNDVPRARPAGKKRKVSVLDLTGSDGTISSDDENPAPTRKRGTKKRIDVQTGRRTKLKSKDATKDTSTPANGKNPSIKLSLTKHNVRMRRPGSKSKKRPLYPPFEGTLAGGERIFETQDSSDSNTESARRRRADDLGDWGAYRGDSPSPETTNNNDTRFIGGEHRQVAKQTFRLGSQSTNNSNASGAVSKPSVNPFAKNEGDDELVDSSSDDSDLDSSQQSDPKKRLFRSSQWKSGASHSSFASSNRIQVGNKRQKRHY